jgi:microcystin-dependent protein
MSDQFTGEIRVFGCNFAPVGWALCNGQLLSISQNSALFSLLGTQFGGNGTSNYALPNLQGAFPINQGQGAGLTDRVMGDTGGEASVTLTTAEIPSHSHTVGCATTAGTASPGSALFGGGGRGKQPAYAAGPATVAMKSDAVNTAGSGGAHENRPPFVVVNFCIALTGIFPDRS